MNYFSPLQEGDVVGGGGGVHPQNEFPEIYWLCDSSWCAFAGRTNLQQPPLNLKLQLWTFFQNYEKNPFMIFSEWSFAFCSNFLQFVNYKKIANDAVRILATLHNNIRALCSMCKSFTFLVPCFGNTGMVTANYAFQLWLGSLKRGWSLSTPSLLFLGLFLQLLV